MPFDEEDDNLPSAKSQKTGLKQVSSQKSIFEELPKKPSQEDFSNSVKRAEDKISNYKVVGHKLSLQFKEMLNDKTLKENKNIFNVEMEKELLTKLIQLAIDINNDSNELEGMGSLTLITLLLKFSFEQRDKINNLEYNILQLKQSFLNIKKDGNT